MNFAPLTSPTPFANRPDCSDTLGRLIGNLSGFVYRRRFDERWTMDFVSAGCRDITGYEPHRFIDNASIAFGDLISPIDRDRVNERVRLAVQLRQRVSVHYSIRVAHGALVRVEDRLTPIFDATGKVLAIEGIIDRARCGPSPATITLPALAVLHLAALTPGEMGASSTFAPVPAPQTELHHV